ncbi:MAG: hypothetical protein KIT36_09115 [Alphaproteobacteria bacterium]|nr:hypothetical protein [Alphaproteobacteria bacterium]
MAGVLAAAAMAAGSVAGAQNSIEVTRNADTIVYGSCVPQLKAVNNTAAPVDYLEVALSFTLKSGESRTLEFRSRYREGIERPIAPGTSADLKVQLDLSRPLGVACSDIVSVKVADTICEAPGGPCPGVLSVDPERH